MEEEEGGASSPPAAGFIIASDIKIGQVSVFSQAILPVSLPLVLLATA